MGAPKRTSSDRIGGPEFTARARSATPSSTASKRLRLPTLTARLPAPETVYHYFRFWRLDGMAPCANECELASKGTLGPAPGRWIAGRQDDRHRRGGTRLRGSKKVKGRRRQLLVDTQDLVL